MKKIPLSKGKFALVDDEDFEWLSKWKWHARNKKHTFYAQRCTWFNKRTKSVQMHRAILGLTDPKIQGDHINGNGFDNRRSNLRRCTNSQNRQNLLHCRGKSKYKGVYWHVKGKKWIAKIHLNKKSMHIGSYDSERKAAIAYDKKALELFGEFAKPNFQNGGQS